MRFADLEDWALGDTVLHRRDARAKIVATLMLLLALSRGGLPVPALALVASLLTARLPFGPVLLRACVVLPFSISFALAAALSGDQERALQVLLRSYLSAVTVVILLGCTPLPMLLEGFRRLGTPVLLLETIQFVYRYLALIGEQSKRMATAAAARGAKRSLTAVAGSVGVLFARSYDRAEGIHRAMLARGYTGAIPHRVARLGIADGAIVAFAASVLFAAFAWSR